ncbi:MAG: hypothetical protein K9M51_01345, partial [Candidatus Gracilibacteria bacterium]|nr:hypothetical protein [Candidatus Gracilibacteria bacterium]
MNLSPFAYNETVAQEYFPLTKEEVISRGLQWKDPDKKDYLPQTLKIPETLEYVSESICKEILACTNCKKNYKIQKVEIEFYKKMKLPLPRKCPDCRHAARVKLRNPRQLFDRTCANCSDLFQTTFAPDRPEQVFCEKCFLCLVLKIVSHRFRGPLPKHCRLDSVFIGNERSNQLSPFRPHLSALDCLDPSSRFFGLHPCNREKQHMDRVFKC